MKTLKLKLEYNMPEGSQSTSQELTADYLISAVNMKHKDGLDGQMRRIFGRIQRKFDEALEKSYDVLELEDAEFDLLDKAFVEAKFPAGLSKFVNVLEVEMERCKTAPVTTE